MSDTLRPTRPFAPVGALGAALRAVVAAGIVASVVVIALQLSLRGPAQDFVDGVTTIDDFEDRLDLFTLVSLLSTLLFVAQVAVTCVWTWRLARNMQGGLARAPQTVSQPGVTVAANILGFCTAYILNVFMWREIWRGSDPDVPPGGEWRRGPVDAIVYVWFALSFVGVVLGFGAGLGQSATGGLGAGDGTRQLAEDLTDGFALTALTTGVGIAAAAAFIVLIQRLGARHMLATGEVVR